MHPVRGAHGSSPPPRTRQFTPGRPKMHGRGDRGAGDRPEGAPSAGPRVGIAPHKQARPQQRFDAMEPLSVCSSGPSLPAAGRREASRGIPSRSVPARLAVEQVMKIPAKTEHAGIAALQELLGPHAHLPTIDGPNQLLQGRALRSTLGAAWRRRLLQRLPRSLHLHAQVRPAPRTEASTETRPDRIGRSRAETAFDCERVLPSSILRLVLSYLRSRVPLQHLGAARTAVEPNCKENVPWQESPEASSSLSLS